MLSTQVCSWWKYGDHLCCSFFSVVHFYHMDRSFCHSPARLCSDFVAIVVFFTVISCIYLYCFWYFGIVQHKFTLFVMIFTEKISSRPIRFLEVMSGPITALSISRRIDHKVVFTLNPVCLPLVKCLLESHGSLYDVVLGVFLCQVLQLGASLL